MSQVNNLTFLNKMRPPEWQGGEIATYMSEVELWIKQVYDNLTNISQVRVYTVVNLPDAADFDPATGDAGYLYVSDETGGATLAFSDGTDWRRVQDRAVVI